MGAPLALLAAVCLLAGCAASADEISDPCADPPAGWRLVEESRGSYLTPTGATGHPVPCPATMADLTAAMEAA